MGSSPASGRRARAVAAVVVVGTLFGVAAPAGAVSPDSLPFGSIVALDLRSGGERWHVLPSKNRLYRVRYVDGSVVVASSYSECTDEGSMPAKFSGVTAFDVATGKVLWRSAQGVGVDFYGGHGIVVVQKITDSSTHAVVAGIDARTGSQVWSHAGLPQSSDGSPDLLFATDTSQSSGADTVVVRAFRRTNDTVAWSANVVGMPSVRVVTANRSTVVLSDGDVLDAKTGRKRFAVDVANSLFVLAGDTLVYPDESAPARMLVGVDATTGTQRWKVPTDWTSGASYASGWFYFYGVDPRSTGTAQPTANVNAIDATSASPRWTRPTDPERLGDLVAAPSAVVQELGTSIALLDSRTGARRWEVPTPVHHAELPLAVGAQDVVTSGDPGSCGD